MLLLEHHHHGQVAVISLNRPQVRNAIGIELIDELNKAFDSLNNNDCRVIVLSGEGASFCAGADITAAHQGIGGQMWDSRQLVNQEKFSNLILRMRAMKQPIIACVQGYAAGGGMCLALAADVIFAMRDAKFVASFANLGLTGCELGTSYFLPRAIGAHNAARYLLTGDVLIAEEAYRLGMVQTLFDTQSEMRFKAMDLAQRMVENMSPLGLELTKKQLNAAMDGMSLSAAIHTENLNQLLCLNHADNMEFMQEKISKFAAAKQNKLSKI